MRLLVTADLHYNHGRSKALAEQLIGEMNGISADALLVVGDTATEDRDALEQCLSRFTFRGPRLFVAGNHELWTRSDDSRAVFEQTLPHRVRALGWHWLEDEPFVLGDVAIVGSVGWYDYAFAAEALKIPRQFYAAKVSPGAAQRLTEFASLLDDEPIDPRAMGIVARWNDGKFVKLHQSDEAFLESRLQSLHRQLAALAHVPLVIAAIHHVPFAELLPPAGRTQWDFARAYLGSPRLGELLLQFPNVRHCFCGHSHFHKTATIGHIACTNIGSGYRAKRFEIVEL